MPERAPTASNAMLLGSGTAVGAVVIVKVVSLRRTLYGDSCFGQTDSRPASRLRSRQAEECLLSVLITLGDRGRAVTYLLEVKGASGILKLAR